MSDRSPCTTSTAGGKFEVAMFRVETRIWGGWSKERSCCSTERPTAPLAPMIKIRGSVIFRQCVEYVDENIEKRRVECGDEDGAK